MRSTRFSMLVAGAAFAAASAGAHEGDHHLHAELRKAWPAALAVQDDDTLAAVTAIVHEAGHLFGQLDRPMLPHDAIVDGVGWQDDLLTIRISVPAEAADARLSPTDVETLAQALRTPFAGDEQFRGVRILMRPAGGDYRGIDDWIIGADVTPVAVPEADEPFAYDPVGGGVEAAGDDDEAGAVATQPVGALSGVTVYMSAGHGWTAGASTWFLQRPLLLGMNEDYGNIDQLNYFAEYCRNAGATVVPMRPVGWQPIEVTIDQDDPGVSYTGAWSDSANAQYYENGVTNSGVAYRFANTAAVESATARYTPTLPEDGYYPVFAFVVASSNRVPQVYRIRHTGGISEMKVDHREVGNGWVWLGNYYFAAAGPTWVEISNESPVAGVVVADGIRFGDGIGDLVRPGPGTVSGFPRDEEGQRYWAHSELGVNAVGFPSSVYDTGSNDQDDNVGTGARLAREMNRVPAGGVFVDRWKRVHLEYHTNAFNGAARGQLTLINSTNPTSNQSQFAQILSDEVDADMLVIESEFEHPWVDRFSATLAGSYGAISSNNNGDEFDATLVELAFHDNQQDAELLRSPRVRRAMARACTQGVIRFLRTLPGSQVPLAFAPDTPRDVRIEDLGGGDVRIAWAQPLADGARGDAASGYLIERSSNGYGFGNPITVAGGATTAHTLAGVPVGQTEYFRVRATNAGGQSPPSEVLAVRRPASGAAEIVIVNGYDRLDRFITNVQALPGGSTERIIDRDVNSRDYVVQHAEALAAGGYGFVTSSNDAIINAVVSLEDYAIAVWILGQESTNDQTFSLGEQARLDDFLTGGGGLFASGSDIAFDLIDQGGGVAFAQNMLQIGYAGDDAGSFGVLTSGAGILTDVGPFDFDPANGAAYTVHAPDILTARAGSLAILQYSGGGVAGVQYTGQVFNAVTFGFPFEAISDAGARAAIMQRVIDFLFDAAGPIPFDTNGDGDVDFQDFQLYAFCAQGPDNVYAPGNVCLKLDGNTDGDVDLADFSDFQTAFTGPNP